MGIPALKNGYSLVAVECWQVIDKQSEGQFSQKYPLHAVKSMKFIEREMITHHFIAVQFTPCYAGPEKHMMLVNVMLVIHYRALWGSGYDFPAAWTHIHLLISFHHIWYPGASKTTSDNFVNYTDFMPDNFLSMCLGKFWYAIIGCFVDRQHIKLILYAE